MLTDITLGQYYPGSSVIHGLDPRAVAVLDGIAVDIQHDLYRRVALQIRLHARAAALIAVGVAGRIIERFVVQRADARRVEHLRHFLSGGTHIQRRAFAAGRVAGVKHGVRQGLVALGGVGVLDEHLRQGTVLFNGKR